MYTKRNKANKFRVLFARVDFGEVLTCGTLPQLDRGQLTDRDQLKESAIRPSQVLQGLQGLHFLASEGRRRSWRDRKH